MAVTRVRTRGRKRTGSACVVFAGRFERFAEVKKVKDSRQGEFLRLGSEEGGTRGVEGELNGAGPGESRIPRRLVLVL